MQRPPDDNAASSGRLSSRKPLEQTPVQTNPLPPQPQHNGLYSPTQRQPPPISLPPITSAIERRYYDPTQDHGDHPVARRNSLTAATQPPFAAQSRDAYAHPDARPNSSHYRSAQQSPATATFPHHSPIQPAPPTRFSPNHADPLTRSPISPRFHHDSNRPQPLQQAPSPLPHQYSTQARRPSQPENAVWSNMHAVKAAEQAPPTPTPPPPRADPMSLSSIMSGNDDPPPRPTPSVQSRRSSKSSSVHPLAVKEAAAVQAPAPTAIQNIIASSPKPATETASTNGLVEHALPSGPSISRDAPKSTLRPDEADVLAELKLIEANMNKTNGFIASPEDERAAYGSASRKRAADVEVAEESRRKRRRTAQIRRHLYMLDLLHGTAKESFHLRNEESAWKAVQAQEIADEKERKKDMQRKRRREKTLANETAKRAEVIEKANMTHDAEERERLYREAQKHEKKLRVTTQLLQGKDPNRDQGLGSIREVTPLGPNLEGGMMGSFQMDDSAAATPSKAEKKKKSLGDRRRKTKEQKQAEKDQAAAAQMALDRGEDLPPIAPKEMDRLGRLSELKRDRSFSEDSGTTGISSMAVPPSVEAFTSKAYNQLYEQIWRDLAKKDVGKVWRIKATSTDTKASNLRKTAQLASKEARRWQLRTNKSMKDVQARAKRSMREMVGFWKRNERDERDQRKMAERQELENAKRAEAEREANRQKRKLNFLISQTELYSHFIGKKVRTEEAEMGGDADVAASGKKVKPGDKDTHTADVYDSVTKGKLPTKVTNFEDLDFDAEDETALREAAVANAQNAVKEAQEKARQFNDADGGSSMDDEGEMNFQNPTSLQSMDIGQPKMLTCQLKEYQLKGLNWLVNLYEQGINGILADEMGLGKTVQSISVMAYLAETHNIWGPFLVIAPASTLHNWHQEITRFVPNMKVLPYWGTAKERKTLRKSWDRKHITYKNSAEFHVMVTSYQLVVQDTPYFQKMKWQYMILDEAQAIKSSSSSRWKSLLGFHCRNRLLLTGTPIQNNMQELWALLHFIMPSLFDSHDEFSDWFSKDIESHAQSNTKLNEDQLKRLHMILKPFMLRRIKKHVQKELGDKIEEDVFCDLTYRQRAYYTNLRNKISIMELIEKAAVGDEQDTATLMNLVMQFRKVCNHPDLFERAETTSPFSFSSWAETASFMREGNNIQVPYSVRNCIEFQVPKRIAWEGGRLDLPGADNAKAGWRNRHLHHLMNIWDGEYIRQSEKENGAFSWLRFTDVSAGEAAQVARKDLALQAIGLERQNRQLAKFAVYDEKNYTPAHALFNIVARNDRQPLADITTEGYMQNLLNVSPNSYTDQGFAVVEPCAKPGASAPPIELYASSQGVLKENREILFNTTIRTSLFGISEKTEELIVEKKLDPKFWPVKNLLPAPDSATKRYTNISVPSMRRFVTDSGKLATLDALLRNLKEEGHRVLLYFQMTRMIDLMEEYLTYRNYKFVRLDGSTKLEDRRDTVADFQTRPEIFVFLLSTRAGGLGINLTSADTVIFYDSDWNPTIDSQAMDRAHRLGQTRQVTVYRLITRGTIEERIRKRALQKEEVQRVVISGHAGGEGRQVEFGRQRDRENRTKDIAMWLADDETAEQIEAKEKEIAEREAREGTTGRRRKAAGGRKGVSLDDMYHEGEGHFDDASAKPSGAATPISVPDAPAPGGKRRKGGLSKKAKTIKQRLAVADGQVDGGLG